MIKLLVLFFSFIFLNSTFSQSGLLQEGNNCFAKGDYACAIEKYKSVIKLTDVRQKKFAIDNLRQAEKFFQLQKMAEAAYNAKNFNKAKEIYLNLLGENPNDENAKFYLKEIKLATITLTVSKNELLFYKNGGIQQINVSSNADSLVFGQLPSWITIQKFDKSISIICTENLSASERVMSLLISAGKITENINIRQSVEEEVSLSVSEQNIFFTSKGGRSNRIQVITNATEYSYSLLPPWCSIQSYKDYFILTCIRNDDTKSRSDWFKLTAEDKEVKINITQEGSVAANLNNQINYPVSPKIKFRYFFMNFGTAPNQKKLPETLMFTLGGKSIYVRLKFNPKVFTKKNYFNTDFSSNELEIINSGRVQNFPSNTNYYYFVNNKMENNRQSATLGSSFGGKKLRIYYGAGYGKRFNFWELNLRQYNTNQYLKNVWAKNINQSWRGIEVESSLLLKLSKFNVMGGVSSIFDSNQKKPFIDYHIGIGFSTR